MTNKEIVKENDEELAKMEDEPEVEIVMEDDEEDLALTKSEISHLVDALISKGVLKKEVVEPEDAEAAGEAADADAIEDDAPAQEGTVSKAAYDALVAKVAALESAPAKVEKKATPVPRAVAKRSLARQSGGSIADRINATLAKGQGLRGADLTRALRKAHKDTNGEN